MAKLFKKPRRSTVIFYALVLVFVVAFCLVMSMLMGRLKTHLEKYQAGHINTQYRLVFDRLFADPDWGSLYEEAGVQDTPFEGKDAFVAYMEEKVGDQPLICFLESNGTSSKKCPVYLGDEQIAVFYMVAQEETEPEEDHWYFSIPFAKSLVSKLKVQSWEFDALELIAPKREHTVSVTTEGDRIVYVNGVALTSEQLISTTETKMEQYLPQGLHGMRRQTFYAEGFLVAPVVTVTDLAGNPVEMVQTSPGCYCEVFAQQQTEPELEAWLIAAAETYSRCMIKDLPRSKLSPYFDTSSQIYSDIMDAELWAISGSPSTRMGEATVSEFFRYSDELVTARVTTVLYAMRYDGTEREYPLDTTFFLRKNEAGEYRIYDMNKLNVQQATTLVRLRFYVDGELTSTMMVDAATSQLQLPSITVPEGKTFTGWYQATTGADGSQSLSLIFLPKEGENTVYIPEQTDLVPMDLQARFE